MAGRRRRRRARKERLAALGGMPGLCPSYRPAFPARRESPPGGIFRNNRSPLNSGAGTAFKLRRGDSFVLLTWVFR